MGREEEVGVMDLRNGFFWEIRWEGRRLGSTLDVKIKVFMG